MVGSVRGVAALLTVMLVATACSGSESSTTTTVAPPADSSTTSTTLATTTTTEPATTTTTVAPPSAQEVLDEAVASIILPDGAGSAIVVVVEADGSVTHAVRGEGPDGSVLAPESAVRIGSVTKTLTATAVLALVESGAVDLDTAASEYVTRVAVAPGITVRDLLQQTSGIPDYTQSDEFFLELFSDNARVWTPEEAVAFVDGGSDFDPGMDWDYSNTNYTILGVLVEEVTGMPFHEVLRSSVFEPAADSAAYLAHFEDGEEPVASYTNRGPAIVAVDFEYTSVATAAWASGAVVTDPVSLADTLGAIFGGEVVWPDSVATMTEPVEYETTFYGIPAAYGFGVFRLGDSHLAHDGSIPGFSTVYAHDTSTGATAIWVVANSGATIPRPSFAAVLDLLGA